ncbi:MAG: YceH family protein [Verrucomicrobiales bacterium]
MDDTEAADEKPSTIALTFEEGRVLGCLIEKAMTTPDHYPLTMNSLFSACNQKSNRDPVVEFDDDVIETALDGLRGKSLCSRVAVAGARVPKFRHTIERALPMFLDPDKMEVATTDEAEKLSRRRIAVIGVLLLRGQQTLGELRTRTERMYHFADLEATQATLDDLAACPAQPLAKHLPAGGGRRVATFVELLTPQLEGSAASAGPAIPAVRESEVEIEPSWREKVETDIAELRSELDRLKASLGE